jgi:hypothetical protein
MCTGTQGEMVDPVVLEVPETEHIVYVKGKLCEHQDFPSIMSTRRKFSSVTVVNTYCIFREPSIL